MRSVEVGVLEHYVPAARAQEDFSTVTSVGIDETASRRDHNYITLFHDLDAGRLLFACEGRDADTVKTFAEDIRAHGGDPDAVTAACIDMSRSYIAGVARHLQKPSTDSTSSSWRMQLLKKCGAPRSAKTCTQEPPMDVAEGQAQLEQAAVPSAPCAVAHASQDRARVPAEENPALPRDIFMTATTREKADEQLSSWFRWARRSKLAPFKRLALTLKAHRDGLLNGFVSDLSNGSVEPINELIQAAKARARGYRKAQNLILMAYLIAENLSYLPASPYRTTSGDVLP